jgi:hypothetical protein
MYVPAEIHQNLLKRLKHTETPQNFTRDGMGGCLVLVCIPVRDFSSVSAGMEWNIQLCIGVGGKSRKGGEEEKLQRRKEEEARVKEEKKKKKKQWLRVRNTEKKTCIFILVEISFLAGIDRNGRN